ncbi:hypothetical protein PR202_ga03532 [Eleusine coracana subsp. coracana]|uniref:Uncharacterized protein n=1 Tax=Eleusine coracana subsp. coracana TaxID=191504 RepID=A0AAV5BP74_ELECO|nr:hypothetical protein PR202_ga03532 [Eleusine coracana subsp. coracana]
MAKRGLYLLQLDENMAITKDEESVGISWHAITGISTAETMQLRVNIADSSVHALVDSGSTHSFLSMAAAQQLKLQPIPRSGFFITFKFDSYILEFDDDEEDGSLPQRAVPFYRVVALPEGHRQ